MLTYPPNVDIWLQFGPLNEENRLLVTNELVEIKNIMIIIDDFRENL